jgi:hypothetical protein
VALVLDYCYYPVNCVAIGLANNPFHGRFYSYPNHYRCYLLHYLVGTASEI